MSEPLDLESIKRNQQVEEQADQIDALSVELMHAKGTIREQGVFLRTIAVLAGVDPSEPLMDVRAKIERLAQAVAEEREACAEIAEDHGMRDDHCCYDGGCGTYIAKEIRARGDK